MHPSFRRRIVLSVAALALALPAVVARAQDASSRAVTVVIPFPPGGISDVMTRHIAQAAQRTLGQPVVIENRPGGGGQIGADAVRRARADGNTLFLANIGSHAINSSLYERLSYDPVRDFEPVIGLFSSPNLVVVSAASPVHTMAELIARAKDRPGGTSYGSQGIGSGGHLSGELLRGRYGLDLVHVPYKGSVPALADLVADRLGFVFDPITNVLPFVRNGRLRALANTSERRSPLLPDVPTLAELGIVNMDINPWFGLVAPKGTPPQAIARLQAAFVEALGDPAVVQRMREQGIEPMGGSSSDFAAFMQAETQRWRTVILGSGIRAE